MDTRRTILDVRDIGQGEELIVCHIKNPSGLPFATWKRRKGETATYHGRYFETEGEARGDFRTRS